MKKDIFNSSQNPTIHQKWCNVNQSKIILCQSLVSDSCSMKPTLEPCKEPLNYISCLVVIVLCIILWNGSGIGSVRNAISDVSISQIFSDSFCVITFVRINWYNLFYSIIIQIFRNVFHHIYKFCWIMFICRAQYNWYWQGMAVYCNVYFCAWNSFESVVSDYVSPFLEAIDDESTDIFSRLNFPCLCADLIAPDRIFCHTLFCCQFCSLRCAVDLLPYLFGISLHLHPQIKT